MRQISAKLKFSEVSCYVVFGHKKWYLYFTPIMLNIFIYYTPPQFLLGTQWLSGRVLDSRLRGRGFEPHLRHCVVSLSKTHLSLLSTGSTQEDSPDITEKLLNQIKQTGNHFYPVNLQAAAFH